MSMDVIADFLTCLRNAIMVRKRMVAVPYSTFKENILKVMVEEGYIKGFQVLVDATNKRSLSVALKYVNGVSAISEIKSISTSGSRVYCESSELKPYKGGLGIKILSTDKGVMSDSKIRSLRNSVKVGGEVICSIW